MRFPINRLRVFTSAIIARLGHRGGQEREPDVIPSEKSAAHRGSAMEEMRTITACFARVPRRCMSRPYMHLLLMFHEVRQISKTRNQLQDSLVFLPKDELRQRIRCFQRFI